MEFNKKLGRKIARARKESDLTQEQLANLLNISRVSVVNIEKGKQRCSIERLVFISKLTGYSIASLTNNTGAELPELPELSFKISYGIHQKLDKVDEKHLRAFLQFYKKINGN